MSSEMHEDLSLRLKKIFPSHENQAKLNFQINSSIFFLISIELVS